MKSKPYYGWAISSMGFFGNAIQGGIIFWSMGLYTSAFEDHFGASRAKVTLIETMLSVSLNLMSPVIGYFVDKQSARHVVTVGALAMGLGLILISRAGSLIHVWVVYATLIPLGVLALGVVPSSALIARWFRRRRGLALGISISGSSVGGALAPPVLTWLFLVYGWRTALLVTGVVVMAMAPVFFRTVVNTPEEKGLERESAADTRSASGDADTVDWSVREILSTRALWLQTLISGSLLAVTLGFLANLSLHAKDLGFTGQKVAVLYSIIAFCSFFGKIAFGFLTDRIGFKRTGALTVFLMICGMLLLLNVEGYPGLVAGCLAIGLATGGVTPIWATMIAQGFGARSFGRAIGVMNPLHIPLTAPSAPLAGYISDKTGSYDLVFLIYIGYVLVAGVALYFLQAPVKKT